MGNPLNQEKALNGVTHYMPAKFDVLSLGSLCLVEDITKSINLIKKGKAPGGDGFPIEFYLHFSVLLVPKLHQLFS